VVSKVAEDETNVTFYYVDIEQSPDLAERFGVSGIPVLVLIKNGEEADRAVGFIPEEQVRAFARS
jgi:thioredoxin 1